MILPLLCLLSLVACEESTSDDLLTDDGVILVLGGQGVAGSATLNALLDAQFEVTALNDNKNYFDYHELFNNRVESLACLRSAGLAGCFELQNYIQGSPKIKAVVDFTSSTKALMEEAVQVFGSLNPEVYVFVSAAAIYDVAIPLPAPIEEDDVKRPESVVMRESYNDKNTFGNNMLGSEEALKESGIPYVILRCADIVGPRDTTYRWWQYQVWSEHFDLIDTAFVVPNMLKDMRFSLTYGGDVGRAVVSAIQKGVKNQVYNIAMEKQFTLPHLLLELCKVFDNGEVCWADYTEAQETYTIYPSNHQGILSIARAREELGFEPASWDSVLSETVKFYSDARLKFTNERNTVLQKLGDNVIPYLSVGPLNEIMTQTETPLGTTNAAGNIRTEL